MSSKIAPGLTGFTSSGAAGSPAKAFSWQDATQRGPFIAAVFTAVALVWCYWMMFVDAAGEWDQPQYSHGWVLPLIALVMLWYLRPNRTDASNMESVLGMVAGAACLLIGLGTFVESLAFLKGVGLAVACLGGFSCCLWGQPFATMSDEKTEDLRFERPDVIWMVTGAGVLIAAIGLLGLGVGPLSPVMFSLLGLLVLMIGPILAAVLVERSPVVTWHEIGAGFAIMLFTTAIWVVGIYYDRMPLAQASFVATAVGALMVIGGMNLVRWAGAPVAFLMLMFPLPQLAERNILPFLQKIAVTLAEMVYTLIGVTAVRQGNVISLPGVNDQLIDMEIAEACSGLSMANLLVAMGVAMVILVKRPWWDRLILLLSVLPIAVISNVFRIVTTGLIWMAMDHFSGGDVESVGELRDTVHTWIGLIVMMPFALGLLLVELKLLSNLTVAEESGLEHGKTLSGGVKV